MLQRAVAYLRAQQADDGGWHSETYGLLKSGGSLTPFVLDALFDAGALLGADAASDERGVAFVVRHVNADGALGLGGAVADYPTYATALGLQVLVLDQNRHGDQRHAALILKMARWLIGQQLTEQHGWSKEHPAYGAWGMGGEPRTPPDAGHIDISMTRYAVDALSQGIASTAASHALLGARVFLRRLRNPDGGSFFSTVLTDKNKAGADDGGGWRSYGSATADGILAYGASGKWFNEQLREDALQLASRHRVDVVPGLQSGVGVDWGVSMLHYYRAASAQVFGAFGVKEAPAGRDWRQDLIAAFAREQREDGSFASESGLMKEDDPLIATALAVKALATALRRP